MHVQFVVNRESIQCADFESGDIKGMHVWVTVVRQQWFDTGDNVGWVGIDFVYSAMTTNDMMAYVQYFVELGLSLDSGGCGHCTTNDGKHDFPCSCMCHPV